MTEDATPQASDPPPDMAIVLGDILALLKANHEEIAELKPAPKSIFARFGEYANAAKVITGFITAALAAGGAYVALKIAVGQLSDDVVELSRVVEKNTTTSVDVATRLVRIESTRSDELLEQKCKARVDQHAAIEGHPSATRRIHTNEADIKRLAEIVAGCRCDR